MTRSRKAVRLLTPRDPARGMSLPWNWSGLVLVCMIWLSVSTIPAFPQQDAPPQSPANTPTSQPQAQSNGAELAAHDEPTTFKVNVKLVLVRAVVRDAQGHAIGNLHKEDFQVFDKRKPQVISQFEVEEPGTLAAKARQKPKEDGDLSPDAASPEGGNAPAVPERFIAYLFDDVHLAFEDLARVRQSAERHFATLRPTDRAAIVTTSGRVVLEYTDDRPKLHAALLQLQPRPISGSTSGNDCPNISYYQADQITNKHDPQAMAVAIEETLACEPPLPNGGRVDPRPMINAVSSGVLEAGDHETRISLGVLKDTVRSLSRMPGQRCLVLISPGFITPRLEYEYTEIIDRAVRTQVIVNTLDARGLYVTVPGGDIANSPQHPPPPGKGLLEIDAASAQQDLLAVLADGTGGVFFHNNNDLDEGLRRVAQAPEYSYVLAFVPQNLKLDGSFHSLKVTVRAPPKLNIQARRGYYAPKNAGDPSEQAKQEIEDAIFSQEELHNLPVKMHTQYFKANQDDAKLVVLTHVDVRLMHFRKNQGRNDNVLTCISALFNRNGALVQGMQKTVTMHWKDETLEHKLGAGITLKTSFDVKPGSYMVRLVVRDAEGQLMSAENGTVEIPR